MHVDPLTETVLLTMKFSLVVAALAATPFVAAQGVIPPHQINLTNPLPGISAGGLGVGTIQQVHLVHLPTDPPNVFLSAVTATSVPTNLGGVGGQDLVTGRYDVLTDTFTPDNLAAAINSTGTEFGMMLDHTGTFAVFDRLPGFPFLASRPNTTAAWQIVGQIAGLPSQSYYDPSLAMYRGRPHLLFVQGTNIAMQPIDLTTAQLQGAPRTIVFAAGAASTANSPTPVVDSNGEIIGVSHHDVTGSDNDHYMSLDLDPQTPSVLFNDTTTWTNNGGFAGGRFIDAEFTPSPYHTLAIDAYWCTGGRAAVGQPMEIRSYVPPTTASNVYVSFLLVGAAFLPTGQTFPGIAGELGLSSIIVGFALPPHNNMNGEAALTLTVPNNPNLSGVVLPLQSAVLNASLSTVAFANTAAMTID